MRKKCVVLVIIVVLLIGVIAGFVIYRQNSTEHTLEWVYDADEDIMYVLIKDT